MASSFKKREFQDRKCVGTSTEKVSNAISQTARYKSRSGIRIYHDWRSGRENRTVIPESKSTEFGKVLLVI